MAWAVEYNTEFGIIEIVFTDSVDSEQAREAIIQSFALSRDKDTDLFLSDYSRAHPKLSTLDILQVPRWYRDEGAPRKTRSAVVYPTSNTGKEDAGFFETACLNRGWQAKAFSGRQAAIDWLLKDRTL